MALSLDLQKSMAKDSVEGGATGISLRSIESSHGPFGSMPTAVVAFVGSV